ncbi:MAG: hypothetical protein WBF06_04920 [Candidatus Acidiferrales bacterium]
MADAGTQKSKSGDLDPKDKKQEEASASEQLEKQTVEDLNNDVTQDLDSSRETQLIEQQDLNQGMNTGTHDSESTGINWGADYSVPDDKTRKIYRGDESDKKPEK